MVQKVLFLILVSIGLSNAEIECYVCSSLGDPNCETLSSIQPQICTLNDVKLLNDEWLGDLVGLNFFQTHVNQDLPMACQKITVIKDEKTIVYRGCQLTDEKVDLCTVITTKTKHMQGTNVTCNTCNINGCNESPSLVFNVWVNLMFLIVLKMFY